MDTDVLVQNMCIWNLDYHEDPDLLEDQYSANPIAALCRSTGRDFTVSGHCTPGFFEIYSGIRILLLFFLSS